jgi:hypothetical protein
MLEMQISKSFLKCNILASATFKGETHIAAVELFKVELILADSLYPHIKEYLREIGISSRRQ